MAQLTARAIGHGVASTDKVAELAKMLDDARRSLHGGLPGEDVVGADEQFFIAMDALERGRFLAGKSRRARQTRTNLLVALLSEAPVVAGLAHPGGTLLGDGSVTLQVPAEALDDEEAIVAWNTSPPTARGARPVGAAVEFAPSGLMFRKPATISMSIDARSIAWAGAAISQVRIATADALDGPWRVLETKVAPDDATLIAEVHHFSFFFPFVVTGVPNDDFVVRSHVMRSAGIVDIAAQRHNGKVAWIEGGDPAIKTIGANGVVDLPDADPAPSPSLFEAITDYFGFWLLAARAPGEGSSLTTAGHIAGWSLPSSSMSRYPAVAGSRGWAYVARYEGEPELSSVTVERIWTLEGMSPPPGESPGVVAGIVGEAGFTSSGPAPGTSLRLASASDMAILEMPVAGNPYTGEMVFVADPNNHRVWVLNMSGAAVPVNGTSLGHGEMMVFAGGGGADDPGPHDCSSGCPTDFSTCAVADNDDIDFGTPASELDLGTPQAIAVNNGDVLIADTCNNRVLLTWFAEDNPEGVITLAGAVPPSSSGGDSNDLPGFYANVNGVRRLAIAVNGLAQPPYEALFMVAEGSGGDRLLEMRLENEDGDFVPTSSDNCPSHWNPYQVDDDLDGVGNDCDTCPYDPDPEQADCDSDGVGDYCDDDCSECLGGLCPTAPDSDADGFADPFDNCITVANPSQGDFDGDGVGDACDICLLAPDPLQLDTDTDCPSMPLTGFTFDPKCGDACDPGPPVCDAPSSGEKDSDGDGQRDLCDPCPFETLNDVDGDGLCPGDEMLAGTSPTTADSDNDGLADGLEVYYGTDPTVPDTDGDGIVDGLDPCPADGIAIDHDHDGVIGPCGPCFGPECEEPPDPDPDGDGIPGDSLSDMDNCPFHYNPGQENTDGDPLGDACDACPTQEDSDDSDEDWIPDSCDNCVYVPNAVDLDQDGWPDDLNDDGFPDNGVDQDGDGLGDACDNCPLVFNPSQYDANDNGVGDACECAVVDDGNPCTFDLCNVVDGQYHRPAPAGRSCDDGDPCNGTWMCDGAGSCVEWPLVIDDGNPCTVDICDPVAGVTHTPASAGLSCSDGNVCNGLETCNGLGGCTSGPLPILEDGNPCTVGSCDPVTGVVHQFVTSGTSCSNDNVCDGAELCDGAGHCLAGMPLKTEDGNPCTENKCDPVTGIYHPILPQGTPCSDGDFVNGEETCDGVGVCQPAPAHEVPPPDPNQPDATSSTAPPLAEVVESIYTGVAPAQTGVAPGTIESIRAGVVRGRVFERDGAPLTGVLARVLGHPEYGETLTKPDGTFELVVNGGGRLILEFNLDGFVTVQRQVAVDWQRGAWLDEVALVRLADISTPLLLDGSATNLQIARGKREADLDGVRRATVVVSPGTVATLVMPNETLPLPEGTATFRATELTVGTDGLAAMPGELPAATAYTYAVELSLDEALDVGAERVEFSKEVQVYVDNFLGLPAGVIVPVGYYDRRKGAWVAEKDGLVVRIVSVENDVALLDINGDGAHTSADEDLYSLWGITLEELQNLADGAYQPSPESQSDDSFWRVSITHLTPWDFNFGRAPMVPAEAGPPDIDDPSVAKDVGDPCLKTGSTIECENQVLREEIAIAGTPYSLVYSSARTHGNVPARTIRIPVSNLNLPSSVSRIDAEIIVNDSRRFLRTLKAEPDQTFVFEWDGLDDGGKPIYGAVPIQVQVKHVYPVTFSVSTSVAVGPRRSFGGTSSGGILVAASRENLEAVYAKGWWRGTIGAPDVRPLGLGGWSLSPNHVYDWHSDTLHEGGGDSRQIRDAFRTRIHRIATGSSPSNLFGAVAAGVDGSIYYSQGARIWRRDRFGTTTPIAGNGNTAYSGDCNSIYPENCKTALNSSFTSINSLVFRLDGTLLVGDQCRVREIRPDNYASSLSHVGRA